jgi:hypothetical protein
MAHVTSTPHLQRFFPTLAASDIDALGDPLSARTPVFIVQALSGG